MPGVLEHYSRAVTIGTTVRWEQVTEFPAGTRYGVVSITPIFDDSAQCTNIVGTVRDLTEHTQSMLERPLLEDQLRQAQKMESIGCLAGGIAHDFNNLLTVINGFSQLLQNALPGDDPLSAYAGQIADAGQRAASLTQQLLAFSRRQVIQPKPIDLIAAVKQTETMLRILIGEDIALDIRHASHRHRVMADPDQIHQVLMNLVANARDAMPDGGRLTIEIAETDIDEKYLRRHG
jgi:two-component system cell cycle sensor histidine kinase/response regulator CckA